MRTGFENIRSRLPNMFAFGPHVLVASLMANVLAFALPLFLLQIYDRIIPKQGVETLTILVVGVGIAIVLELVLRMSRAYLLGLAGAEYERRASSAIFDRFLSADLSMLEKEPPGFHLDRINGIDQIRDFRNGEPAMVKLDLLFAGLFVFVIAVISLFLAAVVVVLTIISLSLVQVLQANADKLSEEKHTVDRRRYSFLIEALEGIEFIKSFNIEPFMERRYERLMSSTANIGATAYERANFAQSVTGIIGHITPVTVASVGAVQVIQGSMSVGGLAACLLLGSRVVQPVVKLAMLKVGEDDVERAERDLAEILSMPAVKVGTMACDKIESIELKDISVKNSDGGANLFESLDLKLSHGETVSIRGGNGSGKSSLLWLMTDNLPPDQGTVLVNGIDIRKIDSQQFRKKVAFLPQKPKLLQGTVLENMTRFQPDLYVEDALKISEALGLYDFFAKHPEGINMKVGVGNVEGLPISVTERVPLVGALVGEPDLILFDEANSNLDFDGDNRLREYLAQQRKSSMMVLVSQRPSYLRMADRHYDLANGRLLLAATCEPSPYEAKLAEHAG